MEIELQSSTHTETAQDNFQCGSPDCPYPPRYGFVGDITPVVCKRHASDGMVDLTDSETGFTLADPSESVFNGEYLFANLI